MNIVFLHRMKKYCPEYLFTDTGCIVSGKTVAVGSNGTIASVYNSISNEENVIALKGLLLPGFVNSHCHLELSWSKGLFPEAFGIEQFYGAMRGVHAQRPASTSEIIAVAIDEQYSNGVNVIADISNTAESCDAKKSSRIRFHTFVETFGLNRLHTNEKLDEAISLLPKFTANSNNSASLSAHTLHTLSNELMQSLMRKISDNNMLHSIHFLESKEEIAFFKHSKPIQNIHEEPYFEKSPFKTATLAAINLLPQKTSVLFVHNTFAGATDIDQLIANFSEPWFCFCPASNLYITGELPNVPMFISKTQNMVIGTDSLASNHELNLLKEIDILLKAFPKMEPEILLQAITINGARMLNVDHIFGSISPNKKPGLVLLDNYQSGLRTFGSLNLRRIE
jgi:cytosine/adenosine deaminase-related metal-dependent hydrolase